MHRMGLWTLGVVFLIAGQIRSAEPISLFNGKDLTGWKGDSKFWSVADGVIVGQTPGIDYNTFLFTEKEYDNFILRFQVRLTNHNSGVQFRSEVVDPKKYVMAGYQADIAPEYWGLLYEEKKRGMLDFKMDTRKLAKTGEWVPIEIRADGPKITITANGTQTVSYTETDEVKGAKTGKIGLQLHGGPAMKVEFKDLTLEMIP